MKTAKTEAHEPDTTESQLARIDSGVEFTNYMMSFAVICLIILVIKAFTDFELATVAEFINRHR